MGGTVSSQRNSDAGMSRPGAPAVAPGPIDVVIFPRRYGRALPILAVRSAIDRHQ